MSKSRREPKAKGANAGREKYVLRLFVAGDEPNSKQAQENLARICDTHLRGRSEVEIVDVLEDFQPALDEGVLVTPALILISPPPRATVLGNLTDTQKVLTALRLTEDE